MAGSDIPTYFEKRKQFKQKAFPVRPEQRVQHALYHPCITHQQKAIMLYTFIKCVYIILQSLK